MICGDIYDGLSKRIANINDLEWRIDGGGFVKLRAIPTYEWNVLIDLGQYRINVIEDVPTDQNAKVYRLSLERVH